MKLLLLLLLTAVFLMAKTQGTCYSVQLKSLHIKNKATYNFEAYNYPPSCKLIAVKSLHAVRCGCYDRYGEAKKKAKTLAKKYPGLVIVKTYKYRFKTQSKQGFQTQSKMQTPTLHLKDNNTTQQSNTTNTTALIQENVTSKPETSNFMEDFSLAGNVNLTTQSYLLAPKDKNPENITASANFEFAYVKNNFRLKSKIRLQEDLNDAESGAKDTHRSYARIDELYGEYEFENDQISLGKNIRFWGALEVRNIADVFNPYDLRADPFEKTKLGIINAAYTHYTDSGELSIIAQLYEPEREMPAYPYVYYYFPKTIQYNKHLTTQGSQYRPDIYIKYSDSLEGDYAVDYNIIFQNGYDSQRYYTTQLNAANEFETNEHAYLVNKFITYDTMVIGATLYKLEAIYTDVLNNDEISDYTHIGLGLEHTLSQVYKEADLGLLAEYYSYDTVDGSKRDDLELFEIFQNDLFLGLRYSFNEGDNSSIVGGTILDLDYSEEVYYVEYETRIADTYKINLDYRYIEPSKNHPTAFHLMGRHERVSLKIGYYF